jgi:MbtH protein
MTRRVDPARTTRRGGAARRELPQDRKASVQGLVFMGSQETDVDQGPTYRAVVNGEGQYSIWFADRETPAGWSDAGKSGSKEECLAFIEEVWTDMRPLSLRRAMGESA